MSESAGVYEQLAQTECTKIADTLKAIAVQDEPNPVKINWDTFVGEGTLFWKQSREFEI